jgi:hypothetical protein
MRGLHAPENMEELAGMPEELPAELLAIAGDLLNRAGLKEMNDKLNGL